MSKRSATTELTQDNWDQDDGSEEAENGTWSKASATELAKRPIRKAVRRTTALTTNEDKPSIFKNFSGFATDTKPAKPMFSFANDSKSPMFNFGKKDDNTSSSVGTTPTFSFSKSTSNETIKSDLSGFKNSTSSNDKTSPLKPNTENKPAIFSGFGNFSSTSPASKKEEKVTPVVNGSSNDLGSKNESKVDSKSSENKNNQNMDSSNDQYLADVKALNISVKNWINLHVDKNPCLNLEPVFTDYSNHFKELQSKYKTSQSSNKASSPSKSINPPPTFSFGAKSPANSNSNNPPPTFNFGAKSPSSSDKTNLVSSSESSQKISSGFSFNDSKTSTDSPLTFGAPKMDFSKSGFSFGNTTSDQSKGGFGSSTTGSIFGSSTGFSFGNSDSKGFGSNAGGNTESTTEKSEDAYEPPKVEVEVKEEGSFYEKKCKLFYKKDGSYVPKEVGILFMKKVEDKTQMIVRNISAIGTILLNIVLNSSMPAQKMGKKDVLIVCVPNPPIEGVTGPTSMLIRVKTPEDADELLEKINENKK